MGQKFRSTVYCFGTWDASQKALEDYLAVKDDLLTGRTQLMAG